MTMKIRKDSTGLDELDLDKEGLHDAANLRRVIAARKGLEDAERELRDAVAAAREAGDSWAAIGAVLDVSRQAAFQRFGRGEIIGRA